MLELLVGKLGLEGEEVATDNLCLFDVFAICMMICNNNQTTVMTPEGLQCTGPLLKEEEEEEEVCEDRACEE